MRRRNGNFVKNIGIGVIILIFLLSLTLQTQQPRTETPINPNKEDPYPQFDMLEFSNYSWYVRRRLDRRLGPGPNFFSDAAESVWLDENGHLHLKIRHNGTDWLCAEVFTEESFGHGTYQFELAPGFEYLDVNTVVGLFTYLDDENEIDIEYARWGHENAPNGQFVVQPYATEENLHSYQFPEQNKTTLHQFTWCEEYVHFQAGIGTIEDGFSEIMAEYIYTGEDNPPEATERVHLNFWLMSGLAPEDNQSAEIVIQNFNFEPDPCDPTLVPDFPTNGFEISGYHPVWLVIPALIGVTMVILKKKYWITRSA